MRNPFSGFGNWSRRHWLWFAVPVVVIVVLSLVVSVFLDEPLRRMTEREMNKKMKGYTAHIRKLDFHPLGFSMDFYDVHFVQNANPDPPVMRIKRLTASVQWRALVHRKLVADFKLVKPIIYVDKPHFETELKDPTPVKDHGWQDALQAMYPLKINEFKIVDGDATYVESGQARPLRVTRIQAVARDIRNVRSAEGEYPSPLKLEAVVFERGQLRIDGHADFLLEPYAGVKGHVMLRYAGPTLPGDRVFDGLKLTYDQGRRALTIDPGDVLRPGRQIELMLLPGIADIDGLTLVPRPGKQMDDAVDVLRFRTGT